MYDDEEVSLKTGTVKEGCWVCNDQEPPSKTTHCSACGAILLSIAAIESIYSAPTFSSADLKAAALAHFQRENFTSTPKKIDTMIRALVYADRIMFPVIERRCLICGAPIDHKWGGAVFCSSRCKMQAVRQQEIRS